MDHTATLNDLARAEIEQLEAEGIRLTPDEVVKINALGWAIQTPETRRLLARGRPVEVGGAVLWPLTLRAIDWLERNGIPLNEITPGMGYAMAHGRSEGTEMDMDGAAASKAVRKWFKSLRATRTEFVEAVQQVDEQDRRPELPLDADEKPMTLGDFSAFLSAVCGGDADFWERRCSVSYCNSVLAMVVMQNRVDRKPCALDPRIVGERAMGLFVERIRAERKAVASG